MQIKTDMSVNSNVWKNTCKIYEPIGEMNIWIFDDK